MSIPPGLIITASLVVNNLRVLENDRKGNKRTLAVTLGRGGTQIEYLMCMLIAYLLVPLAAWRGLIPWTALLTWLSLPLAVKSVRRVLTRTGRPLSAPLGGTRLTALAFSLLFWVGMVFG
jgi:1,4-dihydroxy-2-naphthoate polyprenyltransferase